jgi:hypothetical protein
MRALDHAFRYLLLVVLLFIFRKATVSRLAAQFFAAERLVYLFIFKVTFISRSLHSSLKSEDFSAGGCINSERNGWADTRLSESSVSIDLPTSEHNTSRIFSFTLF